MDNFFEVNFKKKTYKSYIITFLFCEFDKYLTLNILKTYLLILAIVNLFFMEYHETANTSTLFSRDLMNFTICWYKLLIAQVTTVTPDFQ